jgi:uncharacterized protein YecE (DUF72 family)
MATDDPRETGLLFADEPPPARSSVLPVVPSEAAVALAARLPNKLRLGGMSWAYPGWIGQVYAGATGDGQVTAAVLAREGLPAYAAHPLYRAVEIDKAYYRPLTEPELGHHAAQTPDDFRFLVKAHEDCVMRVFPQHARYGKRKGETNARYLDAAYAVGEVVGPIARGLGDKLGAVLIPFPPQDVAEPPPAFAERLGRFLEPLTRIAPIAVELRNGELLTPAYTDALLATGAVHCHNVWTSMPNVRWQMQHVPPKARAPLLFRWLLRAGDRYETANARSVPYDRTVLPDPDNRAALASLVSRALAHDVPTTVLIDNKAEGCAPESIERLAEAIASAVARLGEARLRDRSAAG